MLFLKVGDVVAVFLFCSLKFKTEQTNKESLYQLLKMYVSRKEVRFKNAYILAYLADFSFLTNRNLSDSKM